MESSSRDRSSRMDASSSVRDSSSRRRGTMRKSGSGIGDARRRRRASGDKNSMKQDGSLVDNSSGYTTASARGRGNMDMSGYSTSLRGSSQRRVPKETSIGNGSGDLSAATSTTGMTDSSASGMNRHVQKYRTAQEELQQHQHSKKPEKRHGRRRHSIAQGVPSSSSGDVGSKSPISSRGKRSLSSKYRLISRVAAGTTDTSGSPKTPRSRRRQSIGAENGNTEETLATSSGGSSNSDRNLRQLKQQQKHRPKRRSSLPGNTNTSGSGTIPLSNSRSNRNEDSGSDSNHGSSKNTNTGTVTGTLLKRAFTADAASTPTAGAATLRKAPPPLGVRKKSPIRSVKRNASMPAGKKGIQQPRSRADRRPSGGSKLLGTRSQSRDGGSSLRRASVSGAAVAQDNEQKQRRRRLSKDMASRTSWDTPKSKPKLSSAAMLMFGDKHKKNSGNISIDESSMPSLAALDLSIHAGKRYSADSSTIFTTTTNETDTIASAPNHGNSTVGRKALPQNTLLKAQSYSLLVDNATSHHVPVSPRRGRDGYEDEGSTAIYDSDYNDGDTYDGGDIYSTASIDHGTVATVTTTTSSTMRDGSSIIAADLSRSDVSRRSDESESRGSGGRRRRMMVEGSRKMDGSRMDRSGARRRAKSCDGSSEAPKTPRSSRKSPGRSAARPRRSSRGLASTDRRGSSGSLGRSRSRSGEPKAASRRRASMSASARSSSRDRVYYRERSSSSLEQKRARAAVAAAANAGSGGAIQRNQTTTAIPERQQSSNSLKSKKSVEPPSPRRQRAASSVGVHKSKSPRKRKKTKKKSSKLLESLSQIDTMWVRGSGDKAEMQAAASEAILSIPEGAINVQPQQRNRKSSNMSVGAASIGSSSRKSVGSGRRIRRQNSNGGASVASRGSSSSRKGRRPSKTKPRASDASWSLADIDVGEEKSVATHPIVASKSADDKFTETPRRKRESFRRVKSLGSADGLQSTSRQASQKSISSNPHQQSTPGGNRQFRSDKAMTTTQDPFSMKADEIDPFGSQHGEQFENDLFSANSLPDPFLGPKTQKLVKTSTEKPGNKKVDPLGPSFHMTDDFGDFGDASFANFDGSGSFQVISADDSTVKSML